MHEPLAGLDENVPASQSWQEPFSTLYLPFAHGGQLSASLLSGKIVEESKKQMEVSST